MTEEIQPAKILYVEDDETLGFITRDNLERNGYQIIHCSDGTSAMEVIRDLDFDLAVLDIMLPGVDGFTLAEEIRKRNQEVPILFLSAKPMKEDRLKGFALGADDYVTKPFSIEELSYKIRVFLKRHKVSGPDDRNRFVFGHFEYDHSNLKLHSPTDQKTLTEREGALLHLLLQNKDQICKRSDILIEIWGEDDYFMGRSLDVFISRMRKYLSSDPEIIIENVHSVGFKLVVSS